jgi:hypothetical protein
MTDVARMNAKKILNVDDAYGAGWWGNSWRIRENDSISAQLFVRNVFVVVKK